MWLKSTSSGTSKEATRHALAKPALRRHPVPGQESGAVKNLVRLAFTGHSIAVFG
jgi:hypothetical protein